MSQLAPRAIGTGKVVAPPSSTTPRGPSTNCNPLRPWLGSTPAGQGWRWEASATAMSTMPAQKGVAPHRWASFSAGVREASS